MKDDSAIGWLALFLLVIFGSGGKKKPTPPGPVETPDDVTTPSPPDPQGIVIPGVVSMGLNDGNWVWPIPRLDMTALGHVAMFNPVVSSGYGTPRTGHVHNGVDIMYVVPTQGTAAADAAAQWLTPGTPNENKGKTNWMPPGTPVMAARDGVVWSVDVSSKGHDVVIDHGTYATFYQHLNDVAVPAHTSAQSKAGVKGAAVKAGDIIGTAGYSTDDAEHLRHLHFEVWHGGPSSTVDPQKAMEASWQVMTWTPTSL